MTKILRTGSNLTYVALLRGINLSGHRIVKMDQLRKAFEGLGFEDVKTYIQSGNVVFKGPGTVPQNLVKRIEEKIVRQFGFAVPVVVKTSDEIGEIIRNNPLVKEKGILKTQDAPSINLSLKLRCYCGGFSSFFGCLS